MKINNKGFTLIELLVTIALIGILTGIGATAVISVYNESQNKTNEIAKKNILSSVNTYITEKSPDFTSTSDSNEYICVKICSSLPLADPNDAPKCDINNTDTLLGMGYITGVENISNYVDKYVEYTRNEKTYKEVSNKIVDSCP